MNRAQLDDTCCMVGLLRLLRLVEPLTVLRRCLIRGIWRKRVRREREESEKRMRCGLDLTRFCQSMTLGPKPSVSITE